MATYTPSTTTFHSTITVVSDGDIVNALDANASPKQVADNAAYLNSKLSPLISGGTLTLPGTLDITGANVIINAMVLPTGSGSPVLIGVDGLHVGGETTTQDCHITGTLNATENLPMGTSAFIMSSSFGGNYFDARTRAPKAVEEGPLTTGTNVLAGLSYDHLYAIHTVAGSCTWKFTDAPPDGPDGAHHVVRLSVTGVGPIFVENAAGSSLCTLSHSGTGNVDWAIIACIAGAWTLIENGPAH